MDHHREIVNRLGWSFEGKFEVELTNNTITKLEFCEPGVGGDSPVKTLTSTNYKFLVNVHHALSEMLNFMEAEGKKMGHRYATDSAAEEMEDGIVVDLKSQLNQ